MQHHQYSARQHHVSIDFIVECVLECTYKGTKADVGGDGVVRRTVCSLHLEDEHRISVPCWGRVGEPILRLDGEFYSRVVLHCRDDSDDCSSIVAYQRAADNVVPR